MKTEFKKPVIVSGDLNVAHHDIDIYDPTGKENSACFTKREKDSF
jgi:exonuclease III